MRLGLNDIERLTSVPFVLFAGLVGGVLLSLGDFAHGNVAGAVGAFLILTGAAVGLWWVSVRRRRYSVWSTAGHLTIALALAQIVAFTLIVPRALPADVQIHWVDASEQVLWVQVALSPIRFLGSALLVAVGRLLPGSGRGQAERRVAASVDGP